MDIVQFLEGVITHIKDFWPACAMVRGSARRSETNGGVERSNQTAECKLGAWMTQTGSKHWSVGLPLVQWEINTQPHCAIGMQMPYHMLTGQNPRIGISNLPLAPALIKTLHTEAALCALLGLPDGIPLEDAIVQSYSAARVPRPVLEVENNAGSVSPISLEGNADPVTTEDDNTTLTLSQSARTPPPASANTVTTKDVEGKLYEPLTSNNEDITMEGYGLKRAATKTPSTCHPCAGDTTIVKGATAMAPGLPVDACLGLITDTANIVNTAKTMAGDPGGPSDTTFVGPYNFPPPWAAADTLVAKTDKLRAHQCPAAQDWCVRFLSPIELMLDKHTCAECGKRMHKQCGLHLFSDQTPSLEFTQLTENMSDATRVRLASNGRIGRDALLCFKCEDAIKTKLVETEVICVAAEPNLEGDPTARAGGLCATWEPYLYTSESMESPDSFRNPKQLWLHTLGQLSKVVTQVDLIHAKLRDMFAAVDQENVGGLWRRVLLVKVQKLTWEVLDETGDSTLDTIDCSEEKGPIVEWGSSYCHPSVAHVQDAIAAARKCTASEREKESGLQESPKRKKLRDNACIVMKQGARAMKLNADKIGGDIEVGSIVKVPLNIVDTTKVDGNNLTLVVVERTKHGNAPAKYRLACAKGPLKAWYSRVYITPIPDATRHVLGLDAIFKSWRGRAQITEGEAATSTYFVGEHGRGKMNCKCKGVGINKKCRCLREKRLCSSHCHGGLNHRCKNTNLDGHLV